MATRCIACLFIAYILFVSQSNSQTFASALSIGNFNVSKAVDKVGKVFNGAKNLLGFGARETATIPSTTTVPPTTTKLPLLVVLVPKGFSKKVSNASENGTTTRKLSPPNPTKSSYGVIDGAKSVWNKARSYFTKTTTLPPPRNVWLVPVDWYKLRANGQPCPEGKHKSGQGCLSSSQLAGFSWWTLLLSLTGALLMGVAAWIFYRRRLPGASNTPSDSVKVRPPKLPWPWYPSDPSCTTPRGPAPLPTPATKMAIDSPHSVIMTNGSAPAGKMSAGPPPSYPAPPVPVPAGYRANSLYQTTLPAAAGHVYATPTPPPYSTWPSNASEHVHIYEIPPCFPTYDLADQEIDTTTLTKDSFDPNHARC